MEKIILASGSPRRKDILNMLKIPFEVVESNADETCPEGTSAEDTVKILSARKAAAVAETLEEKCVVIGADTVVFLNGKILGKPKDAADASAMLSSLSGKSHFVYTGISVICGGKTVTVCDKTEVKFKPLSQEEISAYVASGEPLGKAGSYAVQGLGSMFIEKIDGDFFTVVGMSPKILSDILESFGIYPYKSWK